MSHILKSSLRGAQLLSEMSTPSLWESSGLDKFRFESYAKLLRQNNGGHVEEASGFTEIADDHTDFVDLFDADSVNVNALSRFNDDKLKRTLLDRLSELISNEKGGHHVSSSLMIEWPDRVDIPVAKNTGIKETDASGQLLETIASCLRGFSAANSLGLSYLLFPQEVANTYCRFPGDSFHSRSLEITDTVIEAPYNRLHH